MFITNEAHRSPIPKIFGVDGDEFWSTVELALHHAWFILSISQRDPDDEEFAVGRTLLLHNFEQVKQVLSWSNSPKISTEYVQIVTPSHINGSQTWAMDRLKKVWSALEPDESAQKVNIFETASGCIYTDSWVRTAHDQLIDRKLILDLGGEA